MKEGSILNVRYFIDKENTIESLDKCILRGFRTIINTVVVTVTKTLPILLLIESNQSHLIELQKVELPDVT